MDRALEAQPTDWLATGHYARVGWADPPALRPRLLRSADRNKDQTYYLSSVPETKLRRALFPVGNLTKVEVRNLARIHDLPTAARDESMGICFVGQKQQRFNAFLSNYIPPRAGEIVDTEGRLLGQHSGLWNFTIGQGARLPGQSHKMYVAQKHLISNKMVVVDRNDHPMLMCTALTVQDWKWIWEDHKPESLNTSRGYKVTAQIRHRMREAKATLRRLSESSGSYELTFDQPQHAVAQGQILVLWDGLWCLGSGRIHGVRTMHDDP